LEAYISRIKKVIGYHCSHSKYDKATLVTLKGAMGITHVLIQINLQERRDVLMTPMSLAGRSKIKKEACKKANGKLG
jgi:hypothetical protein